MIRELGTYNFLGAYEEEKDAQDECLRRDDLPWDHPEHIDATQMFIERYDVTPSKPGRPAFHTQTPSDPIAGSQD